MSLFLRKKIINKIGVVFLDPIQVNFCVSNLTWFINYDPVQLNFFFIIVWSLRHLEILCSMASLWFYGRSSASCSILLTSGLWQRDPMTTMKCFDMRRLVHPLHTFDPSHIRFLARYPNIIWHVYLLISSVVLLQWFGFSDWVEPPQREHFSFFLKFANFDSFT